jgi:hypothetical protein
MRIVILAALILLLGWGAMWQDQGDRTSRLEESAATWSVRANRGGPCDEIRWKRGTEEVIRLIRCVWRRFEPGHGGVRTALAVARCESGLNPEADGGSSEGLFQHQARYWPGRYDRLIASHDLRSSWGLSPSIWNGRTQAIVTALMVRRAGWSAWSCA